MCLDEYNSLADLSVLNFLRYKGTYCSQEVAVKVLKLERINTEMLRDFSQEVYIMRFVCISAYSC